MGLGRHLEYGLVSAGSAKVDGFGNRFEMTRTMSIDGSSRTPLKTSASKIWPVRWSHHNPSPYDVSTNEDCGQSANMAVNAKSKVVVLIKTAWDLTTIDEESDADNFGNSQDECGEEERVEPVPGGGTPPPPPPGGDVDDCWVEVAWFEIHADGSRTQISPSWLEPCDSW